MKLACKTLLLAASAVQAAAMSTSTKPGDDSSLGVSYGVSYTPDTYDDYEHVASLMNDTCAYNTFMCCWTENDGEGMEDNTDVCRYVDPSGVSFDFPGESEGSTHCHGFGWPEDADYTSHILPLYFFVRNFDHYQSRGYYGK